ncbi:MAG: S9 family peptidase [Actinomycetota bacterium]
MLSPGGEWVAFVARGPEGAAVVVAPAAGAGGETPVVGTDPEPAGAGGETVVAGTDPGPARAGGETVVATDPEPAGRGGVLAWLPGGGLAYRARDSVVVVPVGGRPSVVVEGIEGGAGGLAASPDGSHLAYVVDTRAVTVVATAGGPPEVVSDQAGFALDPAWSPDGALLAWHEWDVPAMPWDESRIVVAPPRAGAGRQRVTIAGGAGVATQEPRFAPDGSALAFLSDAGGWSNLWLAAPSPGTGSGIGPQGDVYRYQKRGGRPLVAEEREHGGPAWGPGARSFAWSPDSTEVAFCRNEAGFGRLCVADAATGEVRELARGVWTSLSWAGGRIAGLRSGARTPASVVVVDPRTGGRHTVATGPAPALAAVARRLPEPEVVAWEAADGAVVRGRLWRPPAAGAGAPPPLLVWAHGGPTDQRRVTFDPRLAFFLTRGWAVLHPDCRGSTGWGRAWAQGLRERWGEADVADVAAGARAAVDRRWGDPARLVAMGGSAGGMAALLLAARDPGLWSAAVALYPVCDLAALAGATHRFEAHYPLGLVGPPEEADRYRSRSPIHVAGSITAAVLLLHGAEDEVVPAAQSRELAGALRARGVAVEHHEYEGEGHGWRSPATVEDELARIASFLARHVG